MMTIAEFLWHKTGDAAYLVLAKRRAKGTTILFAVGAVSGTVLSFELGQAGPIGKKATLRARGLTKCS
jgi:cytochrome bd ubiquinol oxidase subunit I